jgi:hypothetical protein
MKQYLPIASQNHKETKVKRLTQTMKTISVFINA